MSPLFSEAFPEPGAQCSEPGADTPSLLSCCSIFQQQLPGQMFSLVQLLSLPSGPGADSLVKGTEQTWMCTGAGPTISPGTV